jgi:hypothetical protein
MPKLSTVLVVVLLGGELLAGCGSSSKSTSTTQRATTSGQSSAASELTPARRVEACKRIVHAPSALPASTKAKLLKTCEQVGTSTAAQHQVVREACLALASREPAGAIRERALAICRRAP